MKKSYLIVGALVGIAVLGHLAGNLTKGPTVLCSEVQEKQLYGKTVTINGRVVGKRITRNRTPMIMIKDDVGGEMSVAIMPGCTTPPMKMGYRYSFTGTPMGPVVMSCNWPGAVKRLGEYELVHEHKAYVDNGRIMSNGTPIEAETGWHNVQVWKDDKGRTYQESVD